VEASRCDSNRNLDLPRTGYAARPQIGGSGLASSVHSSCTAKLVPMQVACSTFAGDVVGPPWTATHSDADIGAIYALLRPCRLNFWLLPS